MLHAHNPVSAIGAAENVCSLGYGAYNWVACVSDIRPRIDSLTNLPSGSPAGKHAH